MYVKVWAPEKNRYKLGVVIKLLVGPPLLVGLYTYYETMYLYGRLCCKYLYHLYIK